ncbi:NAD(P)H-binding protein [Vibrio superstes]|uniref:Nucleoside-diphosphate sugar epimerase n=1 Tax=Vibrio superstes NBRC 103154 TaxID=1219062 RepID=A0A511QXQ0_9VIBR|nr:NAD(P)H-binding protein [Vibrio superstes]GEM81506.1 nucleoside-diphosphate sugar epimerase [Vibrio superstes NBRC 103154]
MTLNTSIVIAGATGLVGRETLKTVLEDQTVERVVSLSRRKIEMEHSKLQQWITADLSIPSSHQINQQPSVGIIALGTTLKKAGTKEKLKAIDVDLVAETATKMKSMGVKQLIVVSCLGASVNAMSHYLKCKGEMESQIEALEFNQTTFIQPGPLAGDREEKRLDEKVLQGVMQFISPLMIGKLKNYAPIQAIDVAKAINAIVHKRPSEEITRVSSSEMLSLL